jgi:hypothetical protein
MLPEVTAPVMIILVIVASLGIAAPGQHARGSPMSSSPIDPFETFANAMGVHLMAKVVNKHAEGQPLDKEHLIWPMLFTEAFALELFIKSALQLRGKTARGHSVHDLFFRLDAKDQKRITELYDTIITRQPYAHSALKIGVSLEAGQVLKRADTLFVAARYWHEHGVLSKDDKNLSGNMGVGTLCDAIRDFLYELNPDWPDKLRDFKNPAFRVPRTT